MWILNSQPQDQESHALSTEPTRVNTVPLPHTFFSGKYCVPVEEETQVCLSGSVG